MGQNEFIITAIRIILVTAGITNLFAPVAYKVKKDESFSMFFAFIRKVALSLFIVILGIYLKVIYIAFTTP
jgi:hypothetical protein